MSDLIPISRVYLRYNPSSAPTVSNTYYGCLLAAAKELHYVSGGSKDEGFFDIVEADTDAGVTIEGTDTTTTEILGSAYPSIKTGSVIDTDEVDVFLKDTRFIAMDARKADGYVLIPTESTKFIIAEQGTTTLVEEDTEMVKASATTTVTKVFRVGSAIVPGTAHITIGTAAAGAALVCSVSDIKKYTVALHNGTANLSAGHNWTTNEYFGVAVNGGAMIELTLTANCANVAAVVAEVNTALTGAALNTFLEAYIYNTNYVGIRAIAAGTEFELFKTNSANNALTTIGWTANRYIPTYDIDGVLYQRDALDDGISGLSTSLDSEVALTTYSINYRTGDISITVTDAGFSGSTSLFFSLKCTPATEVTVNDTNVNILSELQANDFLAIGTLGPQNEISGIDFSSGTPTTIAYTYSDNQDIESLISYYQTASPANRREADYIGATVDGTVDLSAGHNWAAGNETLIVNSTTLTLIANCADIDAVVDHINTLLELTALSGVIRAFETGTGLVRIKAVNPYTTIVIGSASTALTTLGITAGTTYSNNISYTKIRSITNGLIETTTPIFYTGARYFPKVAANFAFVIDETNLYKELTLTTHYSLVTSGTYLGKITIVAPNTISFTTFDRNADETILFNASRCRVIYGDVHIQYEAAIESASVVKQLIEYSSDVYDTIGPADPRNPAGFAAYLTNRIAPSATFYIMPYAATETTGMADALDSLSFYRNMFHICSVTDDYNSLLDSWIDVANPDGENHPDQSRFRVGYSPVELERVWYKVGTASAYVELTQGTLTEDLAGGNPVQFTTTDASRNFVDDGVVAGDIFLGEDGVGTTYTYTVAIVGEQQLVFEEDSTTDSTTTVTDIKVYRNLSALEQATRMVTLQASDNGAMVKVLGETIPYTYTDVNGDSAIYTLERRYNAILAFALKISTAPHQPTTNVAIDGIGLGKVSYSAGHFSMAHMKLLVAAGYYMLTNEYGSAPYCVRDVTCGIKTGTELNGVLSKVVPVLQYAKDVYEITKLYLGKYNVVDDVITEISLRLEALRQVYIGKTYRFLGTLLARADKPVIIKISNGLKIEYVVAPQDALITIDNYITVVDANS